MRTIYLFALAVALSLSSMLVRAETPVCGNGNIPLTRVGDNSGFSGFLTVDPSPANGAGPLTFLIGAESYIAAGASAAVDGDTISVALSASYLGFGAVTTTCSAATLDPIASGTYTVNVYLTTTNANDTTPVLAATGSLVVTDDAGGGTPSANVPITAGFTGAWYDPNQSGHGLLIEVLPNDQLLAWWFSFSYDPSGSQQVWFGGVGPINGNNTAVINALQTLYGQWIPNFDPSAIIQQPWGMLTFSFTDCNHGRVDFSSVAGYGSGHMDLTRLTQPAGLACP